MNYCIDHRGAVVKRLLCATGAACCTLALGGWFGKQVPATPVGVDCGGLQRVVAWKAGEGVRAGFLAPAGGKVAKWTRLLTSDEVPAPCVACSGSRPLTCAASTRRASGAGWTTS